MSETDLAELLQEAARMARHYRDQDLRGDLEKAEEYWQRRLNQPRPADTEPVAWCLTDVNGKPSELIYGPAIENNPDDLRKVTPLYAQPRPAVQRDVAGLVGALEDIAGTHHHSASAGEYFAKVARRALAAYRKQGDGK